MRFLAERTQFRRDRVVVPIARKHLLPDPLCTLRVRRRRRLTQHSLPGGLLGLPWAGLTPADRASFAGAFAHSITSSASASSVGGTSRLSALQALRLITNSNLLACSTGRSAGLVPFRM